MVSTRGGFSAAWISHTVKVRLFDMFNQEWRAATWSLFIEFVQITECLKII